MTVNLTNRTTVVTKPLLDHTKSNPGTLRTGLLASLQTERSDATIGRSFGSTGALTSVTPRCGSPVSLEPSGRLRSPPERRHVRGWGPPLRWISRSRWTARCAVVHTRSPRSPFQRRIGWMGAVEIQIRIGDPSRKQLWNRCWVMFFLAY